MIKSKKYNILVFALLITCTLALSIGITYARLSGSVSSTTPGTLTFGEISLTADSTWTDSTTTKALTVYPTASLISDDIEFSVNSASNDLYLRVQLSITTTVAENQSTVDALLANEGSIPDTGITALSWIYYNGYYYLCETSSSTPYQLTSLYESAITFLSSETFVMPDFEYDDIDSSASVFATISVVAEAIQTTLPATISSVSDIAIYF